MQKKLLTTAVAGLFVAPVAAMADVTVYGTIDTGVRSISKLATGTGTTGSLLDVANNTRQTNRWGLKGSEDLGGGLRANFTLEGQYASDTGAGPLGTGLFHRKAIVGVSKGGMRVDLGRDYTANFKAQGVYDPMSYTYTGITPAAGNNVAGTRSSNMVTAYYGIGTGGVRVEYAAGEVIDDNGRNTRMGFGADFAFGPVKVAGAFSTQEISATQDQTVMNIGAAYKMGAFTIRGGYSNTETDGATPGTDTETPLLMVGLQYTVSPTIDLRTAFYQLGSETGSTDNGDRTQIIVAMDYNLSKSTALYVEFDRYSLDEPAASLAVAGAAGTRTDGSTGIGVGVNHRF